MLKRSVLLVLLLAGVASFAAQGSQTQGRGAGRGQGPGGGRRGAGPQRDVVEKQGTAVIAGRVVAADTGRPLRRARVLVTGDGRPHVASTDEQGRYRVAGLPAGTYIVTAAKSGFVDGGYGQRRSLRTNVPLEISDGQQASNIDLKLTRGGVVTGHVLDEEGEPLARAMVTVLRQQFVRGEKQLTSAGWDQTDDRGQYRIFGLPPGDYYVSATAGGFDQNLRQTLAGRSGSVEQAPDTTGYAPTYFPGVIAAVDATKVKVAAAQEQGNIDFQVQVVQLSTVKGIVTGGSAAITLVPAEGAFGGAMGGALRTFTRADGTFSISNVTPGRYTIVARADPGANGGPRMAAQALVVAGEEVNVALTPAPGVQLSGTLTLEAGKPELPQGFSGFRVVPSPLGSAATPVFGGGRGGGRGGGAPTDTGQFTISDVMPGVYLLRATGPRGWTMKAIYVDGREMTDTPIEVKSENVGGINVIFTDKISSLTGTVRDARGGAVGNVSVIAFPQDAKLWTPQSRQILTARTDSAGAYRFAAIPAGDYLVVAVDDVEQGEWFDPEFLDRIKTDATKVKVGEGEQKAQDLKPPSM